MDPELIGLDGETWLGCDPLALATGAYDEIREMMGDKPEDEEDAGEEEAV